MLPVAGVSGTLSDVTRSLLRVGFLTSLIICRTAALRQHVGTGHCSCQNRLERALATQRDPGRRDMPGDSYPVRRHDDWGQ